MRIVCLGDSCTYGYGVRNCERWTSIIADELKTEVKNLGVNGDTSGGMLCRLNKESIGQTDIVIVFGGVNDIFYTGSADLCKANIGAAVHQILSHGALPIVCIPMKIGAEIKNEAWNGFVDTETVNSEIEVYGKWIKKFCRTFNVSYIDINETVKENMLLDGLHPNASGHRLVAKEIIKCLNLLLSN